MDTDTRKRLERLADALLDAAAAYRELDVVVLGLERWPELAAPAGDAQNGLNANRLSRLLRDLSKLGITKPLARAGQQFQRPARPFVTPKPEPSPPPGPTRISPALAPLYRALGLRAGDELPRRIVEQIEHAPSDPIQAYRQQHQETRP